MATAEVFAFINEIAPYILAEGKKRGYKIFSTVIAQAIIESRYGKSTLASKYHNYFGLKCGKMWILSGKPSISLKTNEEYTIGKLTSITDYFRVYPDMAAGVAGYYDFIDTRRYANLKEATTYRIYAEMLKADGYATSSTYVNTLCSTVAQYGLAAYDHNQTPDFNTWEVGKTYVTHQDLNVRQIPNGEMVPYKDMTEDGKAHSIIGPSGNAILKRGTHVTVKEVKEVGSCTWLRIPSGWICGKNSKYTYVL